MFRIYDGRTHFWQWDVDCKLVFDDKTITKVHFCNRTDDCSLVCDVYEENGQFLVNVPNVLLQKDWDIHVYAYDSAHTKHEDSFKVRPRSKPADYVYTETEIATWEDLETRMDALEELVTVEGVTQAVKDYMAENPLEIPEEYITETELDEKGYLTEHQSLKGYATEEYVDNAVSDIGGVGASGTGLGAEIFNDYENNVASGQYSHAEGISTTASKSFAHAEGWGTVASGEASHSEGYCTQAKGYYSHAEGAGTVAYTRSSHVQGTYNKIVQFGGSPTTRGGYAHIVGNGTSEENRSNAHTLDWDGNAWFAGKVYVGGTSMEDATELGVGGGNIDVDLSDYVKKSELEAKGYITTIPSEYITENELNSQGFLTSNDVSAFVTEEQVNTLITDAIANITDGDEVSY